MFPPHRATGLPFSNLRAYRLDQYLRGRWFSADGGHNEPPSLMAVIGGIHISVGSAVMPSGGTIESPEVVCITASVGGHRIEGVSPSNLAIPSR